MSRGARPLHIRGAAENNLRDVDVSFSGGISAVVGVSGSGKSSLVFDTLYHEARRRFLETLSLGSPWLRMRPARVRGIDGLGPAVALGQNIVNLNPNSTVATAAGIHPFLRVLYARFAQRRCPHCREEVTVASRESRLALARTLLRAGEHLDVVVPLVRAAQGLHARLLAHLTERYGPDAVEVDGKPLLVRGGDHQLDPDRTHDIAVRLTTLAPDTDARTLRAVLESVEALGSPQVTLRSTGGATRTVSRAPLCPGCGRRMPPLGPEDFRLGSPATAGYRLGDRTFEEFLKLCVAEAVAAFDALALPPAAGTAARQVRRRLAALAAMELGYLPLDRASPTLSRGEAQRVRLAVVLANRLDDLVHVLDEPTIGLDPAQVGNLVDQLARLPGPVVMVEHDRWAVARADDAVELGPGPGPHGGRVVFRGPPAKLWHAETPSGRWFSGRAALSGRSPRHGGRRLLTVRSATHNNLRGLDCALPLGALTVVCGPSGAGKTTLVRDVLLESLRSGRPRGCRALDLDLDGPRPRPVVVDQNPIGRNPRSNPATYTGLADRLRTRFAQAAGMPATAFSFNRPEGACPACAGMGAVEITLPYLPSEWVTCEACEGRRFSDQVLRVAVTLADGSRRTIAEVYRMTVDEAAALFADDPAARRILACLQEVGLGYLTLGQPSPSLSGGEAQRVKLAKRLATARQGDLVVLDEPTTGLHPADLDRLVAVLHRLVDQGCTVVVVEHHPDVIAAADWVVRLGPGGGPDGGRLLHAGPPEGDQPVMPRARPRRQARRRSRSLGEIRVTGAAANNLRDVSVAIPKDALTALVGVSGSGKSSLLVDVLAAEASRRLLECLSLYERQSVREGPEAAARSVEGLGPTVAIGPQRRLWEPRSTVGTATELSFHLGVLLAYLGTRKCPDCGGEQRRTSPAPLAPWACRLCGAPGPGAGPGQFTPASYEAACLRCHGLGTVQEPRVERLIVRPDRPLCAGAMHSPGFFPQSYLSKPQNGGYWMLQALAERYGFDPFETPWRRMPEAARQAFLFGDPEPVRVRTLKARRGGERTVSWRGFFPIVEGWDLGGLYTEHVPCPACHGARLRPELLAVRLGGRNRHELHQEPLVAVARLLHGLPETGGPPLPGWVAASRRVAARRLAFLSQVGLGYLNLDRLCSTLSAGEAQRVKLASLLGAELTGMTVLLDEPSRGLHPWEVGALADALCQLRDGGNTVILVDHDPGLVAHADHLVVLGPGAGRHGGKVVAAGPAAALRRSGPAAARALLPGAAPAQCPTPAPRRQPSGWMVVRGAREHNLRGDDVAIPLGVLTGLCGVSGSGKSTLAIDVLARALAPPRLTTSVAYEEVAPGAHDAIEGAPPRTVVSDQTRAGIRSPGALLGVIRALRRAYAGSAEAAARGLGERDLAPSCDACHGKGRVREDMGFLPALDRPCDACDATGYRAEARELEVRGLSLPALEALTLEQVRELWADHDEVARPLATACSLGLGYLVLGQRGEALSGGEAQRLKLSHELARAVAQPTLYILDEPTVGLHDLDVARLADALDGLVGRGHGVLLVEHHPALLARCDWLLELGPGAGPDGGRVVAAGTPERIAAGATPTAPYLRAVLP